MRHYGGMAGGVLKSESINAQPISWLECARTSVNSDMPMDTPSAITHAPSRIRCDDAWQRPPSPCSPVHGLVAFHADATYRSSPTDIKADRPVSEVRTAWLRSIITDPQRSPKSSEVSSSSPLPASSAQDDCRPRCSLFAEVSRVASPSRRGRRMPKSKPEESQTPHELSRGQQPLWSQTSGQSSLYHSMFQTMSWHALCTEKSEDASELLFDDTICQVDALPCLLSSPRKQGACWPSCSGDGRNQCYDSCVTVAPAENPVVMARKWDLESDEADRDCLPLKSCFGANGRATEHRQTADIALRSIVGSSQSDNECCGIRGRGSRSCMMFNLA